MRRFALIVLAALIGPQAQAQTYVWTDEHGRKHYSDQPPPPSVKSDQRDFGPGNTTAVPPYAVRQAARNHPVTIYVSDACPLCDDARRLLKSRGVPFAEKKVGTKEELEALTQHFDGNGIVPSIDVGSQKFPGFTADKWHAMLDEAGFPKDLKGLSR